MKKQQGFTLIELMIVVAIIGVLSAIAIPAYKNYVAKSAVTSAMATAKALITNAELYAQNNTAATTTAEDIGGNEDMSSLGKITLNIESSAAASSAKSNITFTFAEKKAAAGVIQFAKASPIAPWVCENETDPFVDVEGCAAPTAP
ncbi:prepilin-type N-terminal cleavage/methylation domain-containing protein [Photobacterium carnosum]|uniref:pilin n=1 Tax=Photobacterium carnosum TaxID=2023717 RepID=UPI001FA29548|nr:pilin [Photobacterium carnosum]MCD9548260.1 prepilin-type N-terminal cleavage/methylation domain-containing protein [Photobacterium carnosum]MCF2305766.1 prepilin-type N-terminal cleavage/methylation domain-containing protein [Photobacterium carnosum]